MNNSFESFYSNNVALIDKHYANFKEKKKKGIMWMSSFGIVIIIVLTLLFIYLDSFNLFKFNISLLLLLSLFIVVALAVCYYLYLKREIVVENEGLIREIIIYLSRDLNASYEPNRRISQESIEKMELFNLKNLKYNGKNAILVNYKNNNILFADMEVYYIKEKMIEETTYNEKGEKVIRRKIKKIKKHVFDGCYISATLNKRIAEHIYMIPNNISDILLNGAIKDYITYSGDEVKLENLELSKKYKVYSDDEIQARYILSMSLMERINSIDNEFPGKKYIVFKEGRRFVICLEGFKIEDFRKQLLPIFRSEEKERIKEVFNNLVKLFKIYDILDLGNDLYVD